MKTNDELLVPIKQIERFHVALPLVNPFTTSFGTEKVKHAIIVKITDVEDNIGWGETSVMENPGYCSETTETAWYVQREFLIPVLRRKRRKDQILSIGEILGEWESVRGHEFAKAGIESALWALKAEQEKVSLGEIYGATRDKIPTGVSVGISSSIKELLDRINEFLEQGYKRIKIKIRPGWDTGPVSAIRDAFGDIPLMVDANSAYSLGSSNIEALRELDRLGLMMIEQPLRHDDILAHCKLQKMLNTPICLDESIHSVEQADLALEMGCCQIINIKPGRVGGYRNAILIAEHNPGKVWCGGMLEFGIGRMHNIFLQAREEFRIPGDTSGSDRYFKQDIIDPPVRVTREGYIRVPITKGLGVSVREDMIIMNSLKTDKTTFTAVGS